MPENLFEKYAGKKRRRGVSNESARLFRYLLKAFSEQHGLCFWCHSPMEQPRFGASEDKNTNPFVATCEHIIRIADGGSKGASNVVAAHRACNNHRHHAAGNGGMR